MEKRRRNVFLGESALLAMLRFPDEVEILALRGRFDPPGVQVLVGSEVFEEVDPECEAPGLQAAYEVIDGRLRLWFPELAELGDPVVPGLHTEYRWSADPLRPPAEGERTLVVTTDKATVLAMQVTRGGTVESRLAGDWDPLEDGRRE